MTTDLVLADDHPVVRLGLKTLLEKQQGFRVVGEAQDGPEALQAVRQLRPHVLILDLMMPCLGGLEVISEVKERSPEVRLVVLSMHTDPRYVQEAVKRGAEGYVVKDAVADDIVEAISAVTSGQRYFSKKLQAGGRDASDACGSVPRNRLTCRELEILSMIGRGQSNKEIAGNLSISVRTVETHRARIMRKLGIRSHAGLIHYATRQSSFE